MKKINIKGRDGYLLYLHVFDVNNPKGYIQIIHGMKEHQERYELFIKYLNDEGYTVISSDLRGHGKNFEFQGHFCDRNGYKYLISDQEIITNYIFNEYNTKKVILIAHSMGSVIARNLMQNNSYKYEKVILMGYLCPQKLVNLGLIVTNIIKTIKGPRFYSKLVDNLSLGSFNKDIKNQKTSIDWLSYNEKNINDYLNDKYCGHNFTISAYNDLFHLVKNMANYNLYKDINSDLPILLLGGEDDPCIGYDRGSNKSILVLKKAGFTNINIIKYDKMRHEILNEKNYKNVYNDIIYFLKK